MRSPNLDDIVESSLTRKEAPNHAKNKLATGTWDDVCFRFLSRREDSINFLQRLNQISCSSLRRLPAVDVDVARRSCNAEAPSSVLSSLITWRRVIILEKECRTPTNRGGETRV
ncbi:uncharacterized protein LOC117242040 [Bombus vosnesenskii]|uniref:Uncharacterized protein LOC117242040 n=1 Tax=Bombus vosnesenskii TaxID=207650 RepID=A0A6J3LHX1_9HYME|nr:uncharacterized protein LOC117159383 [Bombus vancouverensis nearcticus]XP_033364266.1 uncharacterized protein LOC117242040 [Bombus vosnesenskii]